MSKRIPIFLGLILIIVAVWLQLSQNYSVQHFVKRLEHLSYDLQLQTSIIPANFKTESPIVIIDIDDNSLKAEGRWPWPRSKLANLIDRLREQNVALVAFDILFAETENNIASMVSQQLAKNNILTTNLADVLKKSEPLFNEDRFLAKSLTETNAILGLTFLPRQHTENELPPPLFVLTEQQQRELNLISEEGFISNIPVLQQVAQSSGFINIYPDEDGVIRRAPLLLTYKNGVYPSLALQTIMSFLNVKIDLFTPRYGKTHKLEGVVLGNTRIRTDENGFVYVPYVGKSYTFPYYSATDVMHGNIPKDALLGKIILIGTSATGEGDIKPTAIDIAFPGVEIQATLALGLLKNSFAYRPAWTYGEQIVMTIILGLLATVIFPYVGPKALSLIIILFPVVMFFINDRLWEKTGLVLSFLIPTLLVVLIGLINMVYGYLFESRRREHLKQMFGQYVPAKHIDEMTKTTGSFALRGEDREMSVLFADIRNFTTISENLSAAQLVDMLNKYLTPMTEVIFKYHGTIDKYVGDLIMAFWGAPLRDRHHAHHALISALAMQKKLKQLCREKASTENWPELHVGIGINSGIMSVGDMGSTYRRNYTVMGDGVNLASRVEELTKFYGVSIIVTENTSHKEHHFVFRKLDRVRVKGKKKGIVIYELIAKKTDITPEEEAELAEYHHALDAYYLKQWLDAKNIFLKLAEQHPDRRIYHIYLERISEFEQSPPPDDWDGTYTHLKK